MPPPAKSQAQRGFLAIRFGPEWMRKHHYANPGPLPEHVRQKKGIAAYASLVRKSRRTRKGNK